MLSGVTVGRMVDAELAPDGKGVTIFVEVAKRYGIHRDARFVVEQVGLLGDQFVVIYPTENKEPLLKDGDEVECAPPFNLQEVARSTVGFIQRVDQTTRVLNEAITRVNNILLSERNLEDVVAGVGNFRQASQQFTGLLARANGVIDSNTAPVATTLTNLVRFSDQLKELATGLQEVVRDNRPTLSATLQNLEETSRTLSHLTQDLEAGKGPAGSLLKDEEWQRHLSSSLANLSVAASNIANYGLLYKPRKPKK
jgi:phospholipid/cholesterol/gamma-HCH transport system substrate-binding protein